jgi:hypothetical protein
MEKIFTKSLFFLLFFALFTSGYASAQTLTIQNFPSGTYSPGSTIAVPFNIGSGGCIQQNNTFQVYLANSSGTIISGPLSTYSGFYATYLNAVIPVGTAPGNYTFVVKSTSPATTSAASPVFTVAAGAAVTAAMTSGETLSGNTIGTCNGTAGLTFDFANSSSTASSTASFFDETTQTASGTVALGPNGTFTAAANNYTVLVKATNGTTIGTQAYALVNNKVTNAFALSGTNTVCLGAALTYIIDPNTIKNNYPGITYHIDWGDGTSSDYSYCDLVASGGNVTKFYASGSCSSGNKTFTITDQPKAPYCASLVTPITTAATVLQVPINSFTFSPLGCSNSPITFTNTSDPGQDPTTLNCINPNARYTWLVDGIAQLSNVPISTLFIYTFTPGAHTITLHLNSSFTGACPAPDVTQNICIQGPPTPAFTLPASPVCLNTPVTVTDQSVVDPGCGSSNTYLWTVTGPAPVNFTGGTSSSSHQPQLTFSQPGTYTVTLAITAQNCGTYTITHTIVVDASPSITMSPNALICGTNFTYSFNTAAGITQTTITGTVTPLAGTYTWTVTGGTFSFAGGTTANSQYPQITFTGYGIYTISVTETNSCGTATKSQNLTFQNVPIITITPVPTICPGSPANLTASISPATYTSVLWSGGAGTFTGATTLTPSYTPTAGEIALGTVTLTLTVNTGLTGACSTISQNVTFSIYPLDKITSATTATICTGNPVNYNITASIAGSTFTWVASNFTGTTTGFTASGSGTPITDVLVNTSATVNSVVKYVITPYDSHGCPGTPLTLKVTVKPDPIITAVPAAATICSGSTGTINLGTNIVGTTYTWTSSVTGSITGNSQQVAKISVTSIGDVLNNTGTTAGSVTYIVTPFNGTCPGTPVTTTVNVQPLPVASNPGPNDVKCNITSYTLNGNTPPAGAGLWTLTSGQAGVVFANAALPGTSVTGLVPGNTYTFKWTITIPGCQSTSNSVTVQDDALSVGGTTLGATTVCSGSNSGNVTLAGQLGNIIRWESSIDNGVTWSAIANTTTTQAYLNLTQVTQYRAVVQNGSCAIAYSTVTIILVSTPAVVSNAGTDQTICNATFYTLNGNNPSPGTGLWTLSSGQTGITFSNPALATATVNGMVPGQTYKFTWTITPALPCAPNSSFVIITDNAPSVGGTTAGANTFCAGSGNSGTISLSGQTGSVIRWESSTDNGVTWSPIANTGSLQTYINVSQTTQYRAVVQNGICAIAYSTPSAITINPQAVISNAGTSTVLCNVTSYPLNGNSPSPGTGLWTVSSGQTGITFSNAALPNATVSGLVPGQTYQFTWTITPGAPCAPNSSSVIVTDDLPSVGGTTSTDAIVCMGSNGATISLAGQVGAVIRWESSIDNGTTWQTIANTTTSLVYTNITQTTQYRAVVQSGVCAIVYSTVTTITVNPAAVISNAGINQSLCNATTYTLNGNSPSPGTGLWTLTSGQTGIAFSDPTIRNPVVTGMVGGQTYKFTWTITPALPCTPNSSTVTITDYAPTVGGNTAGGTTVCSGSSNGNITLSGQVGNILRWESSIDNGVTWSIIANTTTSQPYLNLTQTTQYRAAVQNGICAFAYSTVSTVAVSVPAVTANAGANDEVCNATSYVLHGNNPVPGVGLWTVTSGQTGITFSDPTLASATVSGLLPGQTYQFTWTITPAAPCTPNSSMVTITNDAPSVGGITAGATAVCTGNSNGNITLSGQVGNVIRWESSIDNGTTWQSIVNTTTSQSYFNLTQTTEYRAVVQNGVCSIATSTPSIITVNPVAVTANAGTNQVVCNVTSYPLNGNNPSPGTGLWTLISGQTGITFSNATLPNAVVNGMVPGQTYQFSWTITPAAPCTPNSSSVTITDDAPSVGGTTAGANTVCSGSSNGNITLSGQLGAILRWESSIDNGISWQPIANTTATQPYLNLIQTTQYRAVVQNGVCVFANSSVTTITVNQPAIAANAGANDEICNAITYTLNGNNPTPSTGLWTLTSGQTGITFSNAASNNAVVSGMVPGQTYQFTWTVTPSAPCAPNSNTVTITDDALSVGGTTAGTSSFCAGSGNSGSVTLSGQLGNVIRWESSIDNGVTWQIIANTTTTQSYINIAQTTQYRAVVQNGVCSIANSTPTTITINLPAITPNAGANDEICNAITYTLNGNIPTPGAGLWTLTSGQTGITFSNATLHNAIVSGMVPGQTYQFTWTITPGSPCVAKFSTVTITDDAPSVGGTTGGSNAFCLGSGNNGSITLNGQLGNIIRWESSIDNGTTWQTIANTATSQSYTNLTQTTQYRAVVQNGVCSIAYSTVSSIIINLPAILANAGPNQELCNASSYTLGGNSPGPGSTGLWTVTSGQTGITFSNPTSPTAVASGMTPGQTYQFTWTMIPGVPCAPNSSMVTITDDAPTVGGTTAGGNTFCAGSNASGVITLSGQVGSILRWESSIDNGTTWVTIANTGTTQQFLNLTQSTQYRAVVQNLICSFAYSTVSTVLVTQPAVTPNAGTNQELCNISTYPLNGNNPSPGTGMWTVTSGQTGITFSNPASPTAVASGLIPGQAYQFTWTITPATPCPPISSSVTITDDALSIGGTTAGGNTYCSGTGNSGTITLSGQVGNVLRWELSTDNGITWTAVSNTAASLPYLNVTQTTQYRTVVQNGVCVFAYSTITTIVINPAAVAANAGANQVLCNVTMATLSANNPSPSTGLWTIISGQTGVTFTNAAQNTTAVNGLVPGQTYQFTWTITPTAPCTPNSSTVTITDDAPSIGGTTAGATTVCGSSNNGNITLSGQLGAIVRWESSIDNGTTWQAIANTTTTLAYTNLTQSIQYRAVVQNGICTLAYSTVTAILVSPPAVTADAGIDQVLCNVTSCILHGNNPLTGAGQWTVTSGQTGVIFSNATQNSPTVSGLVPGQTYRFTWTITPAAPCTPNSSSVTITDDAPSIGGTTAGGTTYCAGTNASGAITLTGQLGAVLRWESSIDNGTTWQPIANTGTSLQYLNLTQTTQYRAVVQNGVCTFAYSTISIIVITPPVVTSNAGANQEVCNVTSLPLAANSPLPDAGFWTVTSGQTGVVFSDPTQNNATVSGLVPGQTYQFTWTITPPLPCAPNSSSVTITDDAPSIGGTTAGGNAYCSGNGNNGAITLSGQLGAIVRWESSIDNGTTWQPIANTAASQPYLNVTQTTQYRAVVQNGLCAFAYSTVSTIVINPPAVASNAGADQVLCNVATATLSANNPSPSTGLWTITSNQTGVTFTNAAQNTTTVNGLVPGQTYQFTWTITPTAPCTPNSSTVTITDNAPSIGGNTAGATTICGGSNNGNITLSGQLGAVVRWESSIDNGTTWQAIANTTTTLAYTNLTQSTQYRAVVQNGVCTLAYSTVTAILVTPPAVTANAGADQVLCNTTSATLSGNNPAPGTGLWAVTSGQTGITFTNATQNITTVSGLVPGQTYRFTWTITPAAPCTPNSSTVTIRDDAPSIGGSTAGGTTFCAGTNASGAITLSGQLGAVLRWESSIDNGTTWQPIANTGTSESYINLTQTTQYRAVVQNLTCTFAYSTVNTIVITPPVVMSNAGANQEVCNVTSLPLAANSPLPDAGFWTVTSGQTGVVFSDPTQNNATVSGLVPGQTYRFTWTITPPLPCAPNSSSVTITDDAPSIGGTTAGGNAYCSGSGNNGAITLSGQLGAIVRWESSIDNGTTWTAVSNTTASQPYLNVTQTTQYRAVVQNGLCAFAYSTVSTIVINPPAIASNAGANQEVCNVTSLTLNANSPLPDAGFWTVTSNQTGVVFSDPTVNTATVSGLVPGQTYQFTWTITPTAPCTPNSSTVTITDDAPSIGGTTAGATTVCGGSNNGNITLSGQLGAVVRWESSIDNGTTWQAIANTTATLAYNNLTQSIQYRAVVQNGICTLAYSTVTAILVSPPAVTADAGIDQVLCNVTSCILHGNNPLTGAGQWTVTSGQTGVIFSNATQNSPTVSGLVPGQTYRFTWTITPAAPCTPNSSSVTITDDAPSIGGTTAGSNAFCAGSNINGTITLTGQLGAVLRWESSTDNGTTWQPIANTGTSLQYLNLTQTTQYRAVVQNGVCTFAYSTASTIVVNPPAIPSNAGTDQELCNATTAILSANNPPSGTGLWTLASSQTGVVFSDPTQNNATVSGLVPGQTYQFTWTITPALPCAPNSSSVTITDDAPTVGGTTAGGTSYCAGGNISGVISLSGQLGNIIRWESSIDNGTTWQTIANTTSTQSYLNLPQTTQYRAVVKNGVCTFAYSTVSTIVINPAAVTAFAGPDQEVCNLTSLRLAGNNPLPGSGLWTVTSNQTGVVFSDPTQNNATVSGLIPGQTYQFTWTVSSGAPCTPNTSLVTITDDLPTIGGTTTGSNSYCAGSPNSGAIILAGQVGAILRWESSTDNGVTWQRIVNTTPTQQYINLIQTTQYRAVVQNGLCNFAYSTVSTIVINAPAIQANAGANQELCNASFYILNGNDPLPGTGLWTVTSGQTGIVFSDPTKAIATVTGMIPGNTYQFTWTITPGVPCTPNSSTVTITDDKPTIGGTTSSDATVCAGGNGAAITLTGQVGNILRWETSMDNGNTWQSIVNTSTTQQYINLIQTTQYRAVVQNGVCNFAYSSVTTVTVNQPVPLANAGGNQQLCGATFFTLQGNNPGSFTGIWTQTSGPVTTIVSPNNYQTQVTGLVPGNNYTFLWTIKGLAPCPDSSDPVQVHDLKDVIASFVADKTNGCGPYTVNFTNTSTSLTGVSFLWDFGDGTPTSTAVNPSHDFTPRTDGRDTTFTVSLNIVNNCAQRAPYTVNVTVRPDAPIAYILPQQLIGCSPFTLAVDNYSPGNNKSYTYYLYDGSVLVQQIVTTNKNQVRFNPINVTATKTYSLYMVATGFCGNTGQSKIIPVTISVSKIIAQMFIENGINKGCAPLTVNFVNNSIGADTYYYTIYDVNHVVVDRRQGGVTSLPYTFNTPGTYYVTVTAMNSCATAESNPPIRVDIFPPPLPAFTADLTSGCRNVLVTFTNTTPNDANTQAASMFYDWDFGDGSPHASGFTPPPHSYSSKNSPFTVTLSATNSATGCTNSVSKINYIIITPPPGAEFTEKPDSVTVIPNYSFSFIDKTTGIPKYWNWNFGDRQVSTTQNPYHTYQDTGLYKVTLTTISQLGCDSTISHYVRVTGTPGQVFLPNAFQPDGASIELRTYMAKGSGMKEWHMQIFNNYAQCIWETRKLDDKGAPVEGWDGTYKGSPMPQGVYVWQITARFINGTDWKGNVIKKSVPSVTGVIHLIR